jgi:transcriptional regulator with XRE-family HTH domain
MKNGKPYPPDKERRVRVRVELALRDMTISDLARVLNINQGHLSDTINGIRRSPKTEEKIAAYFGMDRKELFPPRTRSDLEALRRAQEAERRAPADRGAA